MRVKIKVGQKTTSWPGSRVADLKTAPGFILVEGARLYTYSSRLTLPYLLLPSIAWDRLKSDGRKWAGVEARLVRDANMWLLGRLGCVSLLPYLIPPSDYWRKSLTMAGVLLSFVPAPQCQLAALSSYFSPCGCPVEGWYPPTTPGFFSI